MISSRSSAAWMARRKARFWVWPKEVFRISVWYAHGIMVYDLMFLSLSRRLATGASSASITCNSPVCNPAVRAPPSGMKRIRTLSK